MNASGLLEWLLLCCFLSYPGSATLVRRFCTVGERGKLKNGENGGFYSDGIRELVGENPWD